MTSPRKSTRAMWWAVKVESVDGHHSPMLYGSFAEEIQAQRLADKWEHDYDRLYDEKRRPIISVVPVWEDR